MDEDQKAFDATNRVNKTCNICHAKMLQVVVTTTLLDGSQFDETQGWPSNYHYCDQCGQRYFPKLGKKARWILSQKPPHTEITF